MDLDALFPGRGRLSVMSVETRRRTSNPIIVITDEDFQADVESSEDMDGENEAIIEISGVTMREDQIQNLEEQVEIIQDDKGEENEEGEVLDETENVDEHIETVREEKAEEIEERKVSNEMENVDMKPENHESLQEHQIGGNEDIEATDGEQEIGDVQTNMERETSGATTPTKDLETTGTSSTEKPEMMEQSTEEEALENDARIDIEAEVTEECVEKTEDKDIEHDDGEIVEETEDKEVKHGKETNQQTETAEKETSDQEVKDQEVKEVKEVKDQEVKDLLVKLVTINGGWFDSDLRKKIKPIPKGWQLLTV